MLRLIALLCWLCVSPAAPRAEETPWLLTSHPRIMLKFTEAVEPNCVVDCTRYLLIVKYVGNDEASLETEWNAMRNTGCIDIVLPGSHSFACKQASSLAGSAKPGQRYAILRFRLLPAQATSLIAPTAMFRLRDVTFNLSDSGRAALSGLLQPVT